MGTFVEVSSPDRRAGKIVFEEIKRIEGLLSKYQPESEISRLNKSGRIEAAAETFYIISRAKQFWQDSNGAFDVTVGPLMDLWGFGSKTYALPAKNHIQAALKLIGSDKIILNRQNYMIQLETRGVKLDLGAIAKGYAVDCAVNKLRAAGITSCLINAGGDIYCLGDKFGRPWRVAIRHPSKRAFKRYLQLADKAVTTSGDYEQYFIRDNRRYSHIFDPRTGYPADSGVISVSVIADDCLTADTLATAIFVLGKEKSKALLNKFPTATAHIYEEKELK
ncbi:MAG: FAD:protein FMN transferase [Candidatus Omnitrophica bacterium]|nr:FAD:protein FMN transferase [Candidatus Omnitrophota bacterium]